MASFRELAGHGLFARMDWGKTGPVRIDDIWIEHISKLIYIPYTDAMALSEGHIRLWLQKVWLVNSELDIRKEAAVTKFRELFQHVLEGSGRGNCKHIRTAGLWSKNWTKDLQSTKQGWPYPHLDIQFAMSGTEGDRTHPYRVYVLKVSNTGFQTARCSLPQCTLRAGSMPLSVCGSCQPRSEEKWGSEFFDLAWWPARNNRQGASVTAHFEPWLHGPWRLVLSFRSRVSLGPVRTLCIKGIMRKPCPSLCHSSMSAHKPIHLFRSNLETNGCTNWMFMKESQ
jgi:hypothetical protein